MKIEPLVLGDFKIEYPFTIPSGIVTTTADTIYRIANEIPELGIITTKSIGIGKRDGNETPILHQISPDSFLNAVGLSNPGYEEFARELENIYPLPNGKFLLTSIFGGSAEEFVKVAKKLAPLSDGVELNFSCPHAKDVGAVIGRDAELTESITRAVRSAVDIPVVVKLTPTADDIGEIAKAAARGGADAITAINTTGPYETIILSNRVGGMSGGQIRDIGIECVDSISRAVDIPIVAMGGLKTADDVRLYKNANAFGIGSGAVKGMNTEQLKEYFHTLIEDLDKGTNYTEELINDRMMMIYRLFKVNDVKQVADDLKILYFDNGIEADPGQFIFTYINEDSEKPFSIAGDDPLTLAVRRIGKFTSKLFELDVGDSIGVRGPYGNGFKIEDDSVLVGGGTGAAPLRFLAERTNNPLIFLGGRTKEQLLFLNEFEKLGDVVVATEDGSYGTRGLVTHALENYGDFFGSSFYNCGPEGMLAEAARIERRYTESENIHVAVERYMKCGIGVCGSCEINGYRSCADGPVFTIEEVGTVLGRYTRDRSGARIEV